MKKIIKMIALLSFMTFLLSTFPILTNVSASSDEITTCLAPTLNDEFDPNTVLITIKQAYSKVNRVWNASDFGVSNVKSIEDLTAIAAGEQDHFTGNVNFRQMLRVTLQQEGKQEVIDAINAFGSSRYVLVAEANYCVETEWSSVESGTFAANALSPNGETYPCNNWNDLKYELHDIGADAAWQTTKGSASVTVGIVDSGIALHEDLNANVITGKDCVNNNTITTDDLLGHGTAVAGLIGAVGGNNIGITGVNWHVSMVPLQVSAADSADNVDLSAVASAFLYAIVHDIDIMNCSFTFNESANVITMLSRTMSMYDGLIVCAAGNSWDDIDTPDNGQYPACFDYDNLITVGATCKTLSENAIDVIEAPAYYTNIGAISVDLLAPGGAGYGDTSTLKILSTASGAASEEYENGYMFWSGTSFATPLVSGSAALLLSYNSNLTAQQLRSILMSSVDTPVSGATSGLMYTNGTCVTEGRLNVYTAIQDILVSN